MSKYCKYSIDNHALAWYIIYVVDTDFIQIQTERGNSMTEMVFAVINWWEMFGKEVRATPFWGAVFFAFIGASLCWLYYNVKELEKKERKSKRHENRSYSNDKRYRRKSRR